MTISVKELIEWLETLDENDGVFINEDGLTLQSIDEPDAYVEVGGEDD